ncbi:unnamed protein product [Caenorhabditis angaria]|uniref:WW domain-containing protein n=1 Tax=Caenorhabditis angaria TaxID=860376 RepID=A0A9P1I4Z6_9PELO|nr:unnamed protein product [Caenorhabditis angaria]
MSIPPLKTFGNWAEQKSSSGKIYYYNKHTEVSQWEKPQDWKDYDAKGEQDRIVPEKQTFQSTPVPPPMMHPPPSMNPYIHMQPHYMGMPPPPPAAAHFPPPGYPSQYYAPPSNSGQMYPPPPPKAYPPPPIMSRPTGIPPPPPSVSTSQKHMGSHDLYNCPPATGSVVPPPPPPSDKTMRNSYMQNRKEYDHIVSPSTSNAKSNGSISIPSTPGDGGGSIYKRELANLKNGQQQQQHNNNSSHKRVLSPPVNSETPRKKANNGNGINNYQDEQNQKQNDCSEPSTSNSDKNDDTLHKYKYYDPVIANEKSKMLGLMDEDERMALQKITRESLALEATITAEHVASVGARCMVAAEDHAKRIFESQWEVNRKSLQRLSESIQDSVPDFSNAMQMTTTGKEMLLQTT